MSESSVTSLTSFPAFGCSFEKATLLCDLSEYHTKGRHGKRRKIIIGQGDHQGLDSSALPESDCTLTRRNTGGEGCRKSKSHAGNVLCEHGTTTTDRYAPMHCHAGRAEHAVTTRAVLPKAACVRVSHRHRGAMVACCCEAVSGGVVEDYVDLLIKLTSVTSDGATPSELCLP